MTPKKYRKKPVVIEALQFDGTETSAYDLIDWIDQDAAGNDAVYDPYDNSVGIKTLEGVMSVLPGDYVIRGVQGEFYPVKPEIFTATYEEARY